MEIIEQTKQICLQLYLPNQIVNTILEYHGYHIWRNGKFICRLNINDKKYDKLRNLNLIKKINNTNLYQVKINIMINHTLYTYTIEQRIYGNRVHWYMDKSCYHSIYPNIKYTDETYYVFGKHISQNLPMINIYKR
jgi:hypothetical protein